MGSFCINIYTLPFNILGSLSDFYFLKKKLLLLFNKNASNEYKITVKAFTMLQKNIFIKYYSNILLQKNTTLLISSF